MYYLYLISDDPVYRLLADWDVQRTPPESRLEGPRKPAVVFADMWYTRCPGRSGASEGREVTTAEGRSRTPLLLWDLELLYKTVEESQCLIKSKQKKRTCHGSLSQLFRVVAGPLR